MISVEEDQTRETIDREEREDDQTSETIDSEERQHGHEKLQPRNVHINRILSMLMKTSFFI